MDYTKLFHDKTAFERECLQQRMELYGFKNMARMELFLWDLELFLQIQKRLGEHIVLKGRAKREWRVFLFQRTYSKEAEDKFAYAYIFCRCTICFIK